MLKKKKIYLFFTKKLNKMLTKIGRKLKEILGIYFKKKLLISSLVILKKNRKFDLEKNKDLFNFFRKTFSQKDI